MRGYSSKMDHFSAVDVLYVEDQEGRERRLARASMNIDQIVDVSDSRKFVANAKTPKEGEFRLAYVKESLKEAIETASREFGVDVADLWKLAEKSIKSVNPETPIGGSEGSKYKDTKSLGVEPDATTRVDETDPVLDDPKPDKTVDLNTDTAKKAKVVFSAFEDEIEDFGGDPLGEDSEGFPSQEAIDEFKQLARLEGTSLEDDAIAIFLTRYMNGEGEDLGDDEPAMV